MMSETVAFRKLVRYMRANKDIRNGEISRHQPVTDFVASNDFITCFLHGGF